MEKWTLEELFNEASRIRKEGSYTLKATGDAKRLLHQYESYFNGEESKELSKEITRYAYNLESIRADLEELTLDEVLSDAAEIREEDGNSHRLKNISYSKSFLNIYEGYFNGEDAEQLSNAIASLSQDIEIAKAKIERRTIDEVLYESYRIQEEGSFSEQSVGSAKAFLNQYIDYFDGKDAEKFSKAFSSIFHDLEEAMIRERGPRKPRSEEDTRADEERERAAGIIII